MCFIENLRINFAIGRGERSFNQYLADLYLVGRSERIAMTIIISFQFSGAYLCLRLKPRSIEQDITDLSFLRNRIGVIRLVAIIKSLKFGVGRMNVFEKIVLSQNCVIKLDFGILF